MTKEERKEYNKKYYQEHKEELKVYRKINKDEIKAYYKVWYQAHTNQVKFWHRSHKEEHKEQSKAWYQEHKEEEKSRCKAYRESHKEEIKARSKTYRESHKDPVVYLYRDLTDEIVYIGSTVNINRRISTRLNKNQKHLFDSIYREHPDDYKLEIVCHLMTIKDARKLEKWLTEKYQPKYNILNK